MNQNDLEQAIHESANCTDDDLNQIQLKVQHLVTLFARLYRIKFPLEDRGY